MTAAPGPGEHGHELAPRMWPDAERRCGGCGHRYDPWYVPQTRELPPVPYWATEHVNRFRARRWGRRADRAAAES